MSKVLRIQEGGYKVITQEGKEILLDTGESGQVRITGDLIVQGEKTELNVRELNVEDQIVIINNVINPPADTEGIGLPNYASGIEIRRFIRPNVTFLYDEDPDLSYYPPDSPDLNPGSFILKEKGTNRLLGLATNHIQTNNTNLQLQVGEGIVTIKSTGTIPYADRISDDGDIPNLAYIRNYVRAEAGTAIIESYYRYYVDEGNFYTTKTGSKTEDTISGDLRTGIFFTVGAGNPGPDGSLGFSRTIYEVGSFNKNGLFIGDARVSASDNAHMKLYTIEPENITDPWYSTIETDNSSLIINPSTGIVEIRNQMNIKHSNAGYFPTLLSGSAQIYSKQAQGSGGTGIYFSNSGSTDEFCSATKALVYGLIF